MLYRFLLLGQIPGTNIELNFYEIMALITLGLAYLWAKHYNYIPRLSAVSSITKWYRQTDNGAQLTQWAKLIARRG